MDVTTYALAKNAINKATTFKPFPSDFVTDGTLSELVESVVESSGNQAGMAYLGGLTGQCVPVPGTISNIECKVEYMLDGLAVLTASSSNVPPYHWELNTASGEWRAFAGVPAYTSSDEGKVLKIVNGVPVWVLP